MPTARGYAALDAQGPLRPFTFERRAPADDDVVIAIRYCGVCHSDIHNVRDDWGFATYPMVPGHEITGIVTAAGAGVTKFAVGDRVGVGCFVDSCTTCAQRDPDREQYRPGLVLTYNSLAPNETRPTYGGFANAIVVKEGYVLSLPDALPLDAAAPLLCAGITLYSPLRRHRVGPGSRVAIVGMGGLGHIGVKLAHAMGAEVSVLSRSTAKEPDARRFGADRFHVMDDPAAFAALAGRFDLILSTVTVAQDWNAYLSLLDVDGAMVLVGIPAVSVPVSGFPLALGRRSLTASMSGSIRETQEMLAFCAAHGVLSEIEIIGMGDVEAAFERVLAGDVRYRFVIDMATLDAATASWAATHGTTPTRTTA
jgi:uncharacterized zinc-type alcohol dehydrogenase-like protein